MSKLSVKVCAADKTLDVDGEVAVGEQVAVAVEFEDVVVADASTMRLRVRHMNADVAVFPLVLPDPEAGTEGDAWTPDATAPAGTRWTATLNLNTVQLRAAFGARPCDGASIGALLMVDCYDADNAALHALGKVRIRWWDADETISGIGPAPAPVDIGEWAAGIEERLDNAETVVAGLIAEMPDKAAASDVSSLQTTVAGHTTAIASLQSSVTANATAISGKASTESVTSLSGTVSSHTGDSDIHVTAAKKAQWDSAEANVQPDWSQTDISADDYIKNKPAIDTEFDAQSGNAIANSRVAAFHTGYHAFKALVEETLPAKADLVDGKVPSTQLPSYVDDVLEYANLASFPATGETGKIYVALDTNKTYRWGGTAYAEISESLAIGETANTAFAGNRGKALESRGYITVSDGHIVAVIPG